VQLPPQPPSEVVRKTPEILEYFKETDNKYEAYMCIEKVARHLAEAGLYPASSPYYAWLINQAALSEKRKQQRLEDLMYVDRRWASSDEFNDIAQDNVITAVITDDRVNFRKNPEIAAGNIIK